jgi:hypothetical protein
MCLRFIITPCVETIPNADFKDLFLSIFHEDGDKTILSSSRLKV